MFFIETAINQYPETLLYRNKQYGFDSYAGFVDFLIIGQCLKEKEKLDIQLFHRELFFDAFSFCN